MLSVSNGRGRVPSLGCMGVSWGVLQSLPCGDCDADSLWMCLSHDIHRLKKKKKMLYGAGARTRSRWIKEALASQTLGPEFGFPEIMQKARRGSAKVQSTWQWLLVLCTHTDTHRETERGRDRAAQKCTLKTVL